MELIVFEMKYKPKCTNGIVVIVIQLSLIQFINSCLVSIYNKACGGGGGRIL